MNVEVKNMPKYVGLDIHKQTCYATVVDEDGKAKQKRFASTLEGFKEFFKDLAPAEVAMEAGRFWQPVYDYLVDAGYTVKLAHPLKTRLIADVKIKTDASDSEALAQLLKLGWLPTAYVPPKEIRELRELVRQYTYFVQQRTRFKNKIYGELEKRGIRLAVDPFTRRGRRALSDLGVKPVDDCLAVIEVLSERIKQLQRELRARAKASADARLLMTIPGIGYFSALTLLAEIGDINRFPSPERLCSYAGLVSSLHQSGSTQRLGRITKEGSSLLRWVLVECAWMHVNHARDTKLTRFFHRLARRKGRKTTIVATARKLLVTVYWMLKRREEFRN